MAVETLKGTKTHTNTLTRIQTLASQTVNYIYNITGNIVILPPVWVPAIIVFLY